MASLKIFDGTSFVEFTGPKGDKGLSGDGIGTYSAPASGIEWEVNHKLNFKPLLWSCFDDGDHFIIPEKVDVSDLNTAYFYFNESITGEVILSAGSGRSFYGINVKQVDETLGDIVSHSGVDTLGFNSRNFYITRNPPNTDESLVNLRFTEDETFPKDVNILDQLVVGTTEDAASNIAVHVIKPTTNATLRLDTRKDGIDGTSYGEFRDEDEVTFAIRKVTTGASAIINIDPRPDTGIGRIRMFRNSGIGITRVLQMFDDAVIENSMQTGSSGKSYFHANNPSNNFGLVADVPTESLDVSGTMVVRGMSIFKKRAGGFYLPWMEDVSETQPEDNEVLTFDDTSGLWLPRAVPNDFYGITVKQVDTTLGNIQSFPGVNTISFNSDDFYVTQNDPNTDEVIVNSRTTHTGDIGFTNPHKVPQLGAFNYFAPSAGDKVLLFSVDNDQGNVTFERMKIVLEGTTPSLNWNVESGLTFGTRLQRVFDNDNVTTNTTIGDSYSSFYDATVGSLNDEDRFCWFYVGHMTGTVDVIRFSAWQRINA